jgi:hypothetical protein
MNKCRALMLTLSALGLGLVTGLANAITVAQFTGGEFYYDGTSTFSTASASSTVGSAPLDAITNPLGFAGTSPLSLSITGVTRNSGWDVSTSGATGEQSFSGGSFTLSDNSGTLLQGTITDSALTAPAGSNPQVATIFSFNVVNYSVISASLGTGLSAPLPGSYSISMELPANYSTPTEDTPAGLSAFNATGTGTFNALPIPPALWLFGSGLLGMVGIARRKKAA